MSIPSKKRESILKWGVPQELLDKVEQFNEKQALDAMDLGVQSKDVEIVDAENTEEATVEDAVAEEPVAEEVVKTAEEEDAPAEDEAVDSELLEVLKSTAETVIGIAKRVKQVEDSTSERLEKLENLLKSLARTDDVKVAEKAALTPYASITELLSKSVIGNEDALIDGRTRLAKDGPEETAYDEPITGIGFVDQLIKGGRSK
jgi:hypothetical protein